VTLRQQQTLKAIYLTRQCPQSKARLPCCAEFVEKLVGKTDSRAQKRSNATPLTTIGAIRNNFPAAISSFGFAKWTGARGTVCAVNGAISKTHAACLLWL
jgi:hypothetical protein